MTQKLLYAMVLMGAGLSVGSQAHVCENALPQILRSYGISSLPPIRSTTTVREIETFVADQNRRAPKVIEASMSEAQQDKIAQERFNIAKRIDQEMHPLQVAYAAGLYQTNDYPDFVAAKRAIERIEVRGQSNPRVWLFVLNNKIVGLSIESHQKFDTLKLNEDCSVARVTHQIETSVSSAVSFSVTPRVCEKMGEWTAHLSQLPEARFSRTPEAACQFVGAQMQAGKCLCNNVEISPQGSPCVRPLPESIVSKAIRDLGGTIHFADRATVEAMRTTCERNQSQMVRLPRPPRESRRAGAQS